MISEIWQPYIGYVNLNPFLNKEAGTLLVVNHRHERGMRIITLQHKASGWNNVMFEGKSWRVAGRNGNSLFLEMEFAAGESVCFEIVEHDEPEKSPDQPALVFSR